MKMVQMNRVNSCILLIAFLVLVVTTVLHVSGTSFEIEQCSVSAFLRDDTKLGEYDAALADFGTPLWGRLLTGELVFDEDDARSGCSDSLYYSGSGGGEERIATKVALIKRGGCYYATKALNAQRAGADAVIIYDDMQQDLHTMAKPQSSPDMMHIVENITIPTVLVRKASGEALLAALRAGEHVAIEFDFSESISNPDERVEWELWGSSR